MPTPATNLPRSDVPTAAATPPPQKPSPRRRGPAKKKAKRAPKPKTGVLPDDSGVLPPRCPPGFVAVETTPGNWTIIPEQKPRTEFPEPESIIPGVTLRWEALDPAQPELRQMRGHTHTLIVRLPDRREFRFAEKREPTKADIFDAVEAMRQRLDIEQAERDFKKAQRAQLEQVENSRAG